MVTSSLISLIQCTVCSKRVMTNSAMACHMKTHSDRKYFDCPICGTDFDTAAGLREHAQISHADQNGRFPCKECPKLFEDFGLLKKHVRSFHSNRVFQCPECSKVELDDLEFLDGGWERGGRAGGGRLFKRRWLSFRFYRNKSS